MKPAHENAKTGARAAQHSLGVRTSRRTELKNITEEVQRLVTESGCSSGVCFLYVPHTTAGVTVNEADDPSVARDIETTLDKLIPHKGDYHHAEGNSDSHIKTALVGPSECVMIEAVKLSLGRWQGIFFCEFVGPRNREIRVKIVPDRVD